jgi:four helix bundle protein
MDKYELMKKTKKFAVEVHKLVEEIPTTRAANNICYQILKSSSSVAANYRAACRAKSTADFINKLKIVEEESDETLFWLEVMEEVNIVPDKIKHEDLKKESNHLTAIFVKSIKSLRAA